MRVVFAPAAREDLKGIGDYIARDNKAAAKRLVLDLQERAARLGTAPRAGRLRSELKDGLRSVAFGSYVIFYQVEDTTIRVERIIHGARDLGAVFDDEA